MKIAWLHLELSNGPMKNNITKLITAITIAAQAGAKWIITPEMAVQGYFMTRTGNNYETLSSKSYSIQRFSNLAKKLGITIFLGCAEHDDSNGKDYNSCLVIDSHGIIVGRHRKIKTVKWITEAWSTAGNSLSAVKCDGIDIGVLVCADAWFKDNAIALKECGVKAIVVIAAWPPGCGGPPEDAWRRCSLHSGGVPVLICNQTGKTNNMDCSIAKSAVILNGELQYSYCGDEAILVADIDLIRKSSSVNEFEQILFNTY